MITHRTGDLHRRLFDCRQCARRHVRRRGLLNKFLILTLQGAFPRAEMQHRPMQIRKNLHLDVPCLGQIRLEIDAAVPKRQFRLPPDERKLAFQRRRVLYDANALAAAAFGRLDHQRIANHLCGQDRLLQTFHRPV
ncbi:hypothetical protein SDC9_170498 [bioreactor metagenome]|uniref:Uncharacterized protein n=1 Tax=bioreactor metagenome TaxID=1076179 RepID=A0A645GH99_9ZZZZ